MRSKSPSNLRFERQARPVDRLFVSVPAFALGGIALSVIMRRCCAFLTNVKGFFLAGATAAA